MRAGDLRRRITFQTRATSLDSFGQQSSTWSDLLTAVPADIQSLSGRELMSAQAVNAEVSHSIVVRYQAALANPITTAAMRIVYTNAGVTRYFNIMSAQNVDERNRTIQILAAEGLNQG